MIEIEGAEEKTQTENLEPDMPPAEPASRQAHYQPYVDGRSDALCGCCSKAGQQGADREVGQRH